MFDYSRSRAYKAALTGKTRVGWPEKAYVATTTKKAINWATRLQAALDGRSRGVSEGAGALGSRAKRYTRRLTCLGSCNNFVPYT